MANKTTALQSPMPSTPRHVHPLMPNNKYGYTEDNGDIIMTFRVDKETIDRYRRRAAGMALDKYLYENILYRSIIGHVW